MHSSVALPGTIEFINIEPSKFSPLISKCQIKVCYVGDEPNRNHSIITRETAIKMAPSLRGCPIAGFYNETKGDFEGHNRIIDISNGQFKIVDTTRPYGFVDLNAEVWFQKFLDDNEIEHEYMVTNGWLWTELYEEARRIIDKGNNQSMELSEKDMNASWTEDDNGNYQFFIINEALISKLCVLGEDVEPCFEGANVGPTTFSLELEDEFKTKLFTMMNELKEYMKEGGANDVPNEDVNKIGAPAEENINPAEFSAELEETEVVETEPVDEFKKKKNEEDENSSDTQDKTGEENNDENEDSTEEPEDNESKKKKKKYELDEIPEYVTLKSDYSALEASYNQLKTDAEALEAKISELTAFKAQVERKDKEAKIAEFWMLSDSDKEDVIKNIDNYSLDDIESKLAVICFRNKVSLTENETPDNNVITTFNLNSEDYDIPAWVRSALETEKRLK